MSSNTVYLLAFASSQENEAIHILQNDKSLLYVHVCENIAIVQSYKYSFLFNYFPFKIVQTIVWKILYLSILRGENKIKVSLIRKTKV